MIKPLKRVNGTGRYQISGDTLNALIDAANSWARVKIHVEQSESAASSVKHAAEGSILHIVVPPGLTGYSEVELEFCHPTLGNCKGTFLVQGISTIT
jgi:hypothetical protein